MSDNVRKIFNIIIAILVSIGAWTYVVYNNDPTTEVKYKDIPITFVGEDALANRDLGVSSISTELIDVTLKQRRVDTNQITAEDIDVIADVSDAAEGENGISLQISGPDGTQVAQAERRSISIEVEEAETIESQIYVEYDDELAGYEPIATNLTSTVARVIGAKSEIARVDRVAAIISYDDTNNRVWSFTTGLSALDKDGDVIEHLVIYPGEVNFKAFAGITKEVPLKVVTNEKKSGSSDEDDEGDGYERTYSAPDTIVIKGPESLLENIDSVSTETIDIQNMYEDQEVELTYQLPDGIYPAYSSENLVMKVKVTRKETDSSQH